MHKKCMVYTFFGVRSREIYKAAISLGSNLPIMKEIQEKIEELQMIRSRQDQSYLPILQEELFFETNPSVSRELRQTIVYLQFLDNPYSIEDFIPDQLKEISCEVRTARSKNLTRSFFYLLLISVLTTILAYLFLDSFPGTGSDLMEQKQTFLNPITLMKGKLEMIVQWVL